MTEHDAKRAADLPLPAAEFEEEPMLYEEPPRLGWRDALGITGALLALAVIGVAGYIWLTPGMTLGKLLSRSEPVAATAQAGEAASPANASASTAPSTVQEPAASASGGHAVVADSAQPGNPAGMAAGAQPQPLAEAGAGAGAVPAADPLASPHLHTGDSDCPTCGMSGPASGAHVVALWRDGSLTHHDCWDCLFAWGKDQGLTLERAVVLEHGTKEAPRWLAAAGAWYLYGTSRIEMSMPPYVAAFPTRAAAEAAQPELGGEVLDFAGLQPQWK